MTIIERIKEYFDPAIASVGKVEYLDGVRETSYIPYYKVDVCYQHRQPESHRFYDYEPKRSEHDRAAYREAKEFHEMMLKKQQYQQTKMTAIEKIKEFFDPAISDVEPLNLDQIARRFRYTFVIDYRFRPSKIHYGGFGLFDSFSDAKECLASAMAEHQEIVRKMENQKRNRSYMK